MTDDIICHSPMFLSYTVPVAITVTETRLQVNVTATNTLAWLEKDEHKNNNTK